MLAAAVSYVETVLHAPLIINGPFAVSELPAFLTQRYALVEGDILGRSCVLMLGIDIQDDTRSQSSSIAIFCAAKRSDAR